jgi:hypothetical protein
VSYPSQASDMAYCVWMRLFESVVTPVFLFYVLCVNIISPGFSLFLRDQVVHKWIAAFFLGQPCVVNQLPLLIY